MGYWYTLEHGWSQRHAEWKKPDMKDTTCMIPCLGNAVTVRSNL